jgi:hypothetical protein
MSAHTILQCRPVLALSIAALVLCSCQSGSEGSGSFAGSSVAAPVQTGKVLHWPEATSHLHVEADPDAGSARVDLDPTPAPGLSAFWSIASTEGSGSAYFYAEHPPDAGAADTSRIVYAAGATRVEEIRDASSFDYSHDSVGPVPVGGIVVVQHLESRRYLAIVIDAIAPVDPRTAGAGPYAYADIRWYLTSEGSANLAAAPP